MSDEMRIQPFENLLNWMLVELEHNETLFGIPRSLFYTPDPGSPYATTLFGHQLATPIGPGAGPHTQLCQNILAAWLSGGRFIELKTVQVRDELEIPRPCIDMADEGYNVEWSQELKLEQSGREYIKAWVLIHVLRRLLRFEGKVPFGTIFNLSVGYDLEGIRNEPMTRFMDRLQDGSREIGELRGILREKFPQFSNIEIPSQIANSVTLSTMHGCPPGEIEQISRYLMEERGLHTFVKLNPTLLGPERVRAILKDHLGFREMRIPDDVFRHDLPYEQAVALIGSLKRAAAERDLVFGVKLSNTLAMANHRDVLPGEEIYMSGRALYPITMALFRALSAEFEESSPAGSGPGLNVSYSGGADALNVSTILSCGALPVTAVSDLLKPGGYSRLLQYLENLKDHMANRGVGSLEELALDCQSCLAGEVARALGRGSDDQAGRYQKGYHPYDLPKVESSLGLFDCVAAPCRDQCAVLQDVPEYAWLIAQGAYDHALQVVLYRNPLPHMTGYVCDHQCQTRCTRSNYDEPVAIRALKRFVAENGSVCIDPPEWTGRRVAIVGGGPSGLSAAYYLALSGVRPYVYEARDRAGGMPAIAPAFRLPGQVVAKDVERIKKLGAEIVISHQVTEPPETFLAQGFDGVYIASGAQRDVRLGIAGEDGDGVYHALELLERVSQGETLPLEGDVVVIGGGNTAVDAARTAKRLTDGRVTIVYRRTEEEMPADAEEITAMFAEGVELRELTSPTRILLEEGQVVSVECVRTELGECGSDGRRRPVRVAGSEFEIGGGDDRGLQVIVAIGQRPSISFLDGSSVWLKDQERIRVTPETGRAADEELIYAGGDAVRGPATIIQACADGQRAAQAICHQLEVPFRRPSVAMPTLDPDDVLGVKYARARKKPARTIPILSSSQRRDFELVEQTLPESEARAEAQRCLQCSQLCDKCVEVCPNRANYAYRTAPLQVQVPTLACAEGELRIVGHERFEVAQTRQILHVDDFCNECGNCTTFCVHQGRPFTDKPRLFLSEDGFNGEEDNAFHIERAQGEWVIRRRQGGDESFLSLRSGDDGRIYEDRRLRVELGPEWKVRSMTLKEGFEGVFSLKRAVEMMVILGGVLRTLPFVLTAQR